MTDDCIQARSLKAAEELLRNQDEQQTWTYLALMDKKNIDLARRMERRRGGTRAFEVEYIDVLNYHRKNSPVATAVESLANILTMHVKLSLAMEEDA